MGCINLNILFATWNENKFNWLRDGFQCLGLPMMPISKDDISEVEEDGASCEENAVKKSNAIGIRKDTIVISEDSGLFIRSLNGFPGTHTARWAPGTDSCFITMIKTQLMLLYLTLFFC
jgi:XTP/dITP diphosphohydrolase